MNKLEKIKKQLKKQTKELEALQNTKFKKGGNLNDKLLTFVNQEYRYKKWIKMKEIIVAQMNYLNQIGQKPNFSNLSKILLISNKTAKKYWNLVKVQKDLTHQNKGIAPHNKTPTKIYLWYINTIYERIQEVNDYLGRDCNASGQIVTLVDVVDDIETRLPPNERVKLGTIRKWLRNNPKFIFKYSTKKRTKILQKIKNINQQITTTKKLMQQEKIRTNLQKNVITQEEISDKHLNFINNRITKIKPRMGTVVEWDGSFDGGHKCQMWLRIQAVDSHGFSYGLDFDQQEINLGYQRVLAKILVITRPIFILADKRRGVDPTYPNSTIAAICLNLNITIIASSDSNNKAMIEKINGLMHSLTAIKFSNQIDMVKSLDYAKQKEEFINTAYNKKYNYTKPKYNGKKVAKEIIQFIKNKLKVITPDNPQFIRFQNDAYQLIDDNFKVITHTTQHAIVIGILHGKIRVLMNDKLYHTKKLQQADIKVAYLAKSIIRDKLKNNGMIVVNFQSFEFLTKEITNNLHKIMQIKFKRKYSTRISELSRENMKLKGLI